MQRMRCVGWLGLFAVVSLTSVGCETSTPPQWNVRKAASSAPAVAASQAPVVVAPAPVDPASAPTAKPRAVEAEGETWGGSAIAWRSPDDGMAEAKRTNKPVMLVLYTSWCPHCRNYSKVFSEPKVAEASKSFVMIKANSDDVEAFASKYAPDGNYIPRTLFLSSDGAIRTDVQAANPRFRYFYDEKDSAPLLAAMARASKGS